jgi:hypothetical protein
MMLDAVPLVDSPVERRQPRLANLVIILYFVAVFVSPCKKIFFEGDSGTRSEGETLERCDRMHNQGWRSSSTMKCVDECRHVGDKNSDLKTMR